MIQRNTILKPSDNTGITKVKCFHIYEKKKKKIGYIGDFIKVSVRRTLKILKQVLKRKKIRSIVVISKFGFIKPDGSRLRFILNGCVLLKKRLTPRGKLIIGPTVYNIKRKKLLSSFVKYY